MSKTLLITFFFFSFLPTSFANEIETDNVVQDLIVSQNIDEEADADDTKEEEAEIVEEVENELAELDEEQPIDDTLSEKIDLGEAVEDESTLAREAQKPKKTTEDLVQRSTASAVVVGKRKPGFRRLRKQCAMRGVASVTGKKLRQIRKGRKLWTEPHNGRWTKVFRKKGTAFISSDCFI